MRWEVEKVESIDDAFALRLNKIGCFSGSGSRGAGSALFW
jgi:hypothetical protein